jgi:very-short-patch-repair endonuclease
MQTQSSLWKTNPALWEKLKPIAQEKRRQPTEAEKTLWKYLRNRQLNGFIFRRQYCIGPFIVDFYCFKAKLVIEVDGEIHQYKPEEDRIREEYLENLKLKVLRFPNASVLNHTDTVLLQFKSYLTSLI